MKTIINVKADKDVKEDAQKLAKDLGLSLSAVVNAYLKQFVRTRRVDFSIAPSMSPVLEKLLGGIELDIKKNRNLSPVMSSKKDIDDRLSSL